MTPYKQPHHDPRGRLKREQVRQQRLKLREDRRSAREAPEEPRDDTAWRTFADLLTFHDTP